MGKIEAVKVIRRVAEKYAEVLADANIDPAGVREALSLVSEEELVEAQRVGCRLNKENPRHEPIEFIDRLPGFRAPTSPRAV